MSKEDNSIDHTVDWDSELHELLTSCEIDPGFAHRPDLKVMARRRIRKARAAMTAIVVVPPIGMAVVMSGAPATAVAPVCLWGAGWIGYGLWLSAGCPNPITLAGRTIRTLHRGVVLGWRWINYRVFAFRRRPMPDLRAPQPAADTPPF